MRSWRPALRIARRSVRRNLGRSVLVAVLVGVPVAGATMVDVVARTLSAPERKARSAIGSADAQVVVTAEERLRGYRPGEYAGSTGEERGKRDPASVDVAKLLPAGSRTVPVYWPKDVRLQAGDRTISTTVVIADPAEPLQRHLVRVEEGRAPATPHELLISPALADRLDIGPGAVVSIDDEGPLTVTGVSKSPTCHSCTQLTAAAGSIAARGAEPAPGEYLVDLPPGVSAESLWPALAADHGVALSPRDAFAHPERYSGANTGVVTTADIRSAALGTLIVGLGLLEVILLAGTAFAVGARRQTRELGLVAASGGTARHVRRIVLAQGLVLGVLGAAFGIAAGFGLAIAGRPLWERLDDADLVGWAFGPWEIAGAALVGVLSGLAAAVIPAIGAGRMRPVDALAERFRVARRARRRTATAAIALLVAGGLMGLAGDMLLADDLAAYERALAVADETGEYVAAPSAAGPVALVIGGATLLVAGLVLISPAVIGALSGIASRLPLFSRLAVRDAARHRHRTGPATSAIAMAVAGSVVLAFLLAGQFRADELRYTPPLPAGVMSVDAGAVGLDSAREGAAEAAAMIPGAQAYDVREPLRELGPGEEVTPGYEVQTRELYMSPPDDDPGAMINGGAVAIAGDEAYNERIGDGAYDAEAKAALAAGKVLVFVPSAVGRDGRVKFEYTGADGTAEQIHLPAHVAGRERSYGSLPGALISAEAAREHGWEVGSARVYVTYPGSSAQEDVDRAKAAAERTGAYAYFDEGPGTPENGILAAITVVAALVTLIGVAISVALSAAEGRADLATLAAVGTEPRRRRLLAACQALLIAGLGCALGVAGGTFVAFTARATTGSPDFVVPWPNLLVTAIAVPLLAVLVAAVFTPSRLPLVRRAT